jgi:hypothetical protein
MDEWKRVAQWTAREQEQEKRYEREDFRRTLWPMIAMATVPFGWLALSTLDPTQAAFRTILVLVGAVLVAEYVVRSNLRHR